MDEYLGIVKIFAGNFAPKGWALCWGQLLSISQNTALFSILGTTYGGNGTSTFALPDLRGRIPVGQGSGPGLPEVFLGQTGGAPTVTILLPNMPAHNHPVTGTVQLPVNDSPANTDSPAGAYLAQPTANTFLGTPGLDFAGDLKVNLTTGIAGGTQPIDITSPYLGVNYVICLQGLFPSRD
jgi:microcystin-dependent protein